jgi:hypothetical protein
MVPIILCDPVGEVATTAKRSVALNWVTGNRIATLFNNHVSSYRFWKRLEVLLQEELGSSPISTFSKENTFAAAPQETIDNVVRKADLAIVGVGA